MPAISMDEAAKVLNLGFGRNTLFRILREERVLRSGAFVRNQPYQEYLDRGYFRVILQDFKKGEIPNLGTKTLVEEKGMEFIRKKVEKHLAKKKKIVKRKMKYHIDYDSYFPTERKIRGARV